MRISVWIKATMLLAIAFASGTVVGVMYERRHATSPGSGIVNTHDAMHQLVRELDLDPAQQEAISEILARHQSEVDATWHALQPRVRATLDSTSQEILTVLRTDQAVKYRQMIERMHSPSHH
jgi:hypothetical protein